jgi:hypothetical protein
LIRFARLRRDRLLIKPDRLNPLDSHDVDFAREVKILYQIDAVVGRANLRVGFLQGSSVSRSKVERTSRRSGSRNLSISSSACW